jgi:hypothetical protein
MMTTQIPQGLLELKNVPNILVNGGMEVWQRGTSFSSPSNSDITSDKWILNSTVSPTCVISKETSVVDIGGASMKFSLTVASGAGNYQIGQTIENGDKYVGKVMTLSARVRSDSANAIRIGIYNGSTFTYSSYHSGGGTYETLSVSATISASGMQVRIALDPTVTQTSYATSLMLVVGDQPIDFVPEDPAIELMRCQRYYQRVGGKVANEYINCGHAYANNAAATAVRLPVELSSTPTVTITGQTGFRVWDSTGTPQTATAVSTGGGLSPLGTEIEVTVSGTPLTAGNAAMIYSNATSSYIEFEV